MKLLSKKDLENLVVLDVETVSGGKTVADLSPRMQDLWKKRCDYLRRKHADNAELSDEEIYEQKAGLQAEWGKIVCISVSYVRFNQDGQPVIKTKSYAGDDEKELLRQFFNFAKQLPTQIPDAKFVGHSIKRFDIPYIFKRGFINGLDIPRMLITYDKKPWEIPVIDTGEIWANGAWQEGFASLDVLTAVLDIPSPKSDIDGSEVTRVYWQEGNLDRITQYCERDVAATMQLMLRFSGIDIATEDNILSV